MKNYNRQALLLTLVASSNDIHLSGAGLEADNKQWLLLYLAHRITTATRQS